MLKIIAFFFLFLCSGVHGSEHLFMSIPEIITDVEPDKVALGKQLFNDSILSKDQSFACSSCHILENYGVDGLSTPVGINGKKNKRNTPSIWNVRYNFVQTWDGRNISLSDQTIYAIENSFEMAENMENIIRKLKQNKQYRQRFKQLYPDGVTKINIVDAMIHFLKTLVTPDSKFDRYLQGEKDILNDQEIAGFKLFQSKGCVACHNGISIGANLYQKLGVFDDTKAKKMGDYGRYLITNNSIDKYFFKVPSLRNVEKTAPYLHNGSVKSLQKVVKVMGELQLGQQLKDSEIKSIVAFLKTLTGNISLSTISNP